MFCTECGQPMADEAKFCAYCGTRRVVPPVAGQTASADVKPEPQAPAPVTAPARTIRSTAEIMPIRLRPNQRSVEEASSIEQEQVETTHRAVPLREEEAAPLFSEPEPPPARKVTFPPPRRVEPPAPDVSVAPPSSRYGSVPFAAEPGSPDAIGERRRLSPILIGAIVVALIAIGGIVWMLRSSMSISGKAAQAVSITIYPTSAKVAPGKGVDFVAEVTGAPGSEVTWSVEEGDNVGSIQSRGASAKEDTISLYCTYTTPQKPGTYHLVATSTADKTKSATAVVTVAGK